MSYEGYYQVICEKGHLSSIPDPEVRTTVPKCDCGCEVVWWNPVDQTNGDDVGFIPEDVWKNFLASPEKTEVCNLGHQHVISEATYRVPSEKEREASRHYLEHKGGGKYTYVPCQKRRGT